MEDETNARGFVSSNKIQILKIAVFLLVTFLISLLAYKIHFMNKAVEQKNEKMKEYVSQMENIIKESSNLIFITWKDQKDGILFSENPGYKPKKSEEDVGQLTALKEEVQELQNDLAKKNGDIQKLLNKEKIYLEHLEKLKLEYQRNKKKIIDEGTLYGNNEAAFREFKWIVFLEWGRILGFGFFKRRLFNYWFLNIYKF